MYNQILGHRNHWDSAGVGASFLCVAHCLVTPLLATALPVLASIEGETHRFFSIIILLLGMLAFIPGYREHKNKIIPALGFTGISLIIFAAMLPEMINAVVIFLFVLIPASHAVSLFPPTI